MSTGVQGLPPLVRDALQNARLTNYNFMGYSGNEAAEQVCDDIEKAMLAAPVVAKLSEEHLAQHWLSQMDCDHAGKQDRAVCCCGFVTKWAATVGGAARLWAEHALLRSQPAGTKGE